MARKTLLTEGEIRQFMKLASLPAVGDGRLHEFVGLTKNGKEDPSLEEMEVPEEEEEVDIDMSAGPDDIPVEDDLGDDLGDDEMGVDDAEGDSVDVDAEELVTRIAHDLESLARMAGVDVDVQDDGPEGSEDMDMELDAELGPEGAPDGLPVDDEEEEPDMGGMMQEEEIVNEVARRVAERLKSKNTKDEMVSSLAERILHRITNAK